MSYIIAHKKSVPNSGENERLVVVAIQASDDHC
jgi:hypothetical protein